MEDGLQIELLHTELININHINKNQTALHVLKEVYTNTFESQLVFVPPPPI